MEFHYVETSNDLIGNPFQFLNNSNGDSSTVYITDSSNCKVTSSSFETLINNDDDDKIKKKFTIPTVNVEEENKTGPSKTIKLEWQSKSKLDFVLEKFLFVKYFWDIEADNQNKDLTEKILHTVINSIFMHFTQDTEQNLVQNINIYNWDDLFESTREFMLAVLINDTNHENIESTCNQNINSCLSTNIFKSPISSLSIVIDGIALRNFVWYITSFNPGFQSVNVTFVPPIQTTGMTDNLDKYNDRRMENIIGQIDQSLKTLKHKMCSFNNLSQQSVINNDDNSTSYLDIATNTTTSNLIDNKYVSSKNQLPNGLLLSVLFYDKLISFIYERVLFHSKHNIKLQQMHDCVKFNLREIIGSIVIHNTNTGPSASDKNILQQQMNIINDINNADDDDDKEMVKFKRLKPNHFRIKKFIY